MGIIESMKTKPKKLKIMVNKTVIVNWFPKIKIAFLFSLFPNAREIIDPPPTPIDIPNAAIKKETGKTNSCYCFWPNPLSNKNCINQNIKRHY